MYRCSQNVTDVSKIKKIQEILVFIMPILSSVDISRRLWCLSVRCFYAFFKPLIWPSVCKVFSYDHIKHHTMKKLHQSLHLSLSAFSVSHLVDKLFPPHLHAVSVFWHVVCGLFIRCVESNIILLTQAFQKKFVIPDFQTFTSHIDDLYESSKSISGGQVCLQLHDSHCFHMIHPHPPILNVLIKMFHELQNNIKKKSQAKLIFSFCCSSSLIIDQNKMIPSTDCHILRTHINKVLMTACELEHK